MSVEIRVVDRVGKPRLRIGATLRPGPTKTPLDERASTEAVVREVMENVTELRVPLVVDMGFGPTWAEAK